MDYERRNISLPVEVNRRLRKDGNASGTIVTALETYWRAKDSGKRIVALADELNRRLDELTGALADLEVIKRELKAINSRINPFGN